MDCREDFVCTSPMECDATTGNCITPVTPLGMPCVSDGECSVGYCARADSVGLESRSARLCSMACCTDSDCPGESICFASDAGVKMCLPGSLVGRTKGPGTSFTACGSGPECQSGLCGGGDGCVGNCALDAHCGSGNTCMIANVNGVAQFVCQQGATGGGSGAPCGGGCRSGICLTPGDLCGAACRTTADCPSGWYCGWLEFTDGSGSVQVCSPRPGGAGSGTDGDFCLSDLDCRDLQCVRSYAECWDSCCSDADCGGGRCKAVYISRGRFETHCEP
jgi:hypothetical protein